MNKSIKNNRVKCIAKVLTFTFVFSLFLNHFTFILRNKKTDGAITSFYQEDVKIDVLFLGNSTTYSGISPLDLWHDYGIVSNNLAVPGQGLDINYYMLEDALNYQKPLLVVVDVSLICAETNSSLLHVVLDNMPCGISKAKAIADLTYGIDTVNFVFPIVYYHSNWTSITATDYKAAMNFNKGATVAQYSKGPDGEVFDTSVFSEPLNILPENEKLNVPQYQLGYIEKMIQLCKKNNIHLLFINYPSYATGKTNHGDGETLQRYWNGFADVAEQGDVDYINGLHEVDEIGFDFVADLRDWRHLSVSGNKKMTSYLGEYIKNNYEIEDRRGEKDLESWDSEYKEWGKKRRRMTNNEESMH